jgi:hypothetical protein
METFLNDTTRSFVLLMHEKETRKEAPYSVMFPVSPLEIGNIYHVLCPLKILRDTSFCFHPGQEPGCQPALHLAAIPCSSFLSCRPFGYWSTVITAVPVRSECPRAHVPSGHAGPWSAGGTKPGLLPPEDLVFL